MQKPFALDADTIPLPTAIGVGSSADGYLLKCPALSPFFLLVALF
jgi:hypothetical protein